MIVPEWFTELLGRELRPWLTLSPEQVSQLYTHYELLSRWNQKINLTSLEPGAELVLRHYCESLFLGVHLPIQRDTRIADIGSGAGFPGVPVAVIHPHFQVNLVESVQRKAVFLREATRHLSNVRVIAKRAEDLEGGFDWLISRAVAPKEILRNIPRLAKKVALLIGEDGFQEVQATPAIAWSEPLRLPWGDRRLCVFGQYVPRGTVPRET